MKKLTILILFSLNFYSFAQNPIADDFKVFLGQDTVLIGTYTQKNIYIVADSTPIYKNAKIKISFPKIYSEFAWDNMFWLIIPPNQRAGYLQAKSVSSGKRAVVRDVQLCANEFPITPSNLFDYKFAHENNQYLVTLEMLDTLPKGDTLLVIYGANGPNTYTNNFLVNYSDNFSVLIDNTNSGQFVALRDQPQIVYKYKEPKSLSLTLASTGNIGKPSLLKIAVFDLGKNIAKDFTGTVSLSCTDPTAVFPSIVTFTQSDKGCKDVYINCNQNGVFTASASVLSSNLPVSGTYTSNPINISTDTINIYWGELHTHTKFSRDGNGGNSYEYARNGGGFDFYCGTDHADFNAIDTFGINRIEWNSLQQEALQVNQPNRFISFLGYENSLDNPSGHYNFIYNFDDSSTNSIPMLTRHFYYTINNLWDKLNQLNMQGKVLTIPHHTGKLFGATGSDNGASSFGGVFANADYKRSIEIYSGHGQSEYYNPNHNLAYEKFGGRSTKFPCYAQDAWALGEKLSVISSTDSHNGRMAYSNSGVTAIIADSLTRNCLFKSMYNRHTYGTTGERMILKFTADKNIMGDETSIPCDSFPTIRFTVNGTDALDFIELLKWDFKNGTYTTNPRHPIYKIIKRISFSTYKKNYSFAFIDTTLRDSSLYYVRVKQKNIVNNREVWAWSSPIWINKPHCDTIYNTDSLYNFNLDFHQPQIAVKWCMQDEFNTDYFVIERSSGNNSHFNSLDTIHTANIAFYDSCYTYIDKFPNDSLLYYRIKIVGYNDSIKYSNIDSIKIPFVRDSIFSLKVKETANSIDVNWSANEFFASNYAVQKSNISHPFFMFDSLQALNAANPNSYFLQDFMPLKDTSYYRVIMNLPNGTFLISNLDTLIFRLDSLVQFDAQLHGDTVHTTWKGIHEKDIIKYELQRSQDRNTFYTIQQINPIGSIFDTTQYQYNDTTALQGKNYYRVVQYMFDGSIKTSIIDSIFIQTTNVSYINNVSVQLNIIDNILDEGHSYLNIKTQSNKFLEGTYMIIGIDGKLFTQQKGIIKNGNNIDAIPIGSLSSGVYYLLFITNDVIIKNNFIIAFHGGCVH